MKFRIASDLHLEFLGDYKSLVANNGRDWNDLTIIPQMEDEKNQILILAGDIVMIKFKERFSQFFKDLSDRFQQIIVIMGNHEHYRNNIKTSYQTYKEFLKSFDNIVLLEKESIIIDNIAIFGATLWTDFNKRNQYEMGYASQAMSDFLVIEYSAEDGTNHMRWDPELSVLEHEKTLEEITKFFKEHKKMKKVILSHHSPSFQSTSFQYKGSSLNSAFASDLEKLIAKYNPELWLHGHMHNSSDYMMHNTHILCNPRGYDNGHENPFFNDKLVVEI
jgi:predicted phosphohydrolase